MADAQKPDFGELMKMAQEMQTKMQAAQQELTNMSIQGESGGGLVKITMNGRHEVPNQGIVIEAGAISEGRTVLEDLVAAAINDTTRKVEKAAQEKMMAMTKGMDLPTGGEGGTGSLQ